MFFIVCICAVLDWLLFLLHQVVHVERVVFESNHGGVLGRGIAKSFDDIKPFRA